MRYLLFLLIGVLTVASFIAPDAKSFQEPALARMIFFHLPCAITTTILVFVATYASIRYLQTREQVWDARALAANEVGGLFCVLTMITGILFSKVQWGAWWQWDPRQTSFLMVMLLYGAYFIIRSSFTDEGKKMNSAAVYWAFALLPNLFLIFVFPRLPQVMSFHPSNTVVGGGFDRTYGSIIGFLILTFLGLSVWIYRLQAKLHALEYEVEKAEMEEAGISPSKVVSIG